MAAPLVLLVLNLLVFGGFAIYSGNPGEFQVGYLEVLGWLAPRGLLAAVLLWLAAWPMSLQGRQFYNAMLVLLAVIMYVHGNLLYWDTGVLDGNALDLTNPWRNLVDAALWFIGVSLAWRFRQWLLDNAWKVCSVLVLFQLIGLAVQSRGETVRLAPLQAVPAEALELSRHNNVVHIVLDGFQASIFEHVIEEEPALENAFDGFTFFRDAVTPSDVTYLSVPATLSGIPFTNDTKISEYHRRTLEGKNLYTFLAEQGYAVDVATPVRWNRPNPIFSSYYRIPTPYANYDDTLRSTALTLTDISLFRQVPHFLKPWIYGNGAWMLSRWLVREPQQQFQHFAHNRFMRDYSRRSNVESSVPRYKFLHLVTPHAPLVANPDCGFTGEQLAYSLESASAQSRCTLKTIVAFLRRLKKLGVYGQSMLIIHGDHGGGIGFDMYDADGRLTNSAESLHRMWGNPLPLLLVKPPGAKGPLKVSNKAVSLTDIPATVADLLALENTFPGDSVYTPQAGEPQPRYYYRSTVHRNEAAAKDHFDDFSAFVIRGSIYDVAAWSEQSHFEAPALSEEGYYEWGTPLSFGKSGTFRPFQKGGWSPSRTGNTTWTNGKNAEFSIPLPATSSAVILRLYVRPMIVKGKLDGQHVILKVGGQELASWELTEARFDTLELRISPKNLETEKNTVFTFELPDARSPASLRVGRDARELALAFLSLQLDLADEAPKTP